jgi:hypothetical protein
MRFWFKARRAHTVLPAALTLFTVLLAVLRDHAAQLPALIPSFSGTVVTALLVPIPVCAGLILCLDTRLDAAEDSGVRPVLLLDGALILATLLAAAVLATLVGSLADSRAAYEAGRNTAFLCGLALCLRPLLGVRAVFAPVVWIMAIAEAGYHYGHPLAWTVVARPLSDPYAATGTAVIALGGLTAHLLTGTSERARNTR